MRPSNSPNSNITRENDDDTSSSIDTLPSCHPPTTITSPSKIELYRLTIGREHISIDQLTRFFTWPRLNQNIRHSFRGASATNWAFWCDGWMAQIQRHNDDHLNRSRTALEHTTGTQTTAQQPEFTIIPPIQIMTSPLLHCRLNHTHQIIIIIHTRTRPGHARRRVMAKHTVEQFLPATHFRYYYYPQIVPIIILNRFHAQTRTRPWQPPPHHHPLPMRVRISGWLLYHWRAPK